MLTKKIMLAVLLVFVLGFGAAASEKTMSTDFIYAQKSAYGFKETVERIENDLKKRDIPVFAKFDHAKNARDVSLDLGETTVIVFGDPKVGTKLMQETQIMAVDLPLKILVWQDKDKNVYAGFIKTSYMAEKFGMASNPVIGKMQGLLEAIVAAGTK